MVTTRFAPSPTGNLHLGHAYSALVAAREGHRLLIRIEDIDITRCKPEFEAQILNDLKWLGLEFEEPIVRQSDRQELYDEALEKLNAKNLLYPCFCTRKDIERELAELQSAPHGPEGPLYPGTCKKLTASQIAEKVWAGDQPAWRLDAKKAAEIVGSLMWEDKVKGSQVCEPEILGDFIVVRKGIGASYHLSVVVDDAAQEIDLVVRGEDLFRVTHVHRLLQALLDLPTPVWHHHDLVLDSDGKRLAKRTKATTLKDLRDEGWTPEQVRRAVGFG